MTKNKKSINSLLFWTFLGALALVLIFCFTSVVWTNREFSRNDPKKTTETYQDELKRISKALNEESDWKSLKDDQKDSVIKVVRTSQLLLLHQQENLISDFRQEMNNNINKVNTWLAFAVGLLSVLGVFVPLVLQYRIQNQEEEKFKVLENHLMISLEKEQKEFDSKIKDAINHLNNNVNCIKSDIVTKTRDLQDLENNIKRFIELSSLTAHFYAFHIGVENNLLQQHPDREDLFRKIWNNTIESFSKICEDYQDIKKDEIKSRNQKIIRWEYLNDKRMFLIEGLIKLHGMLSIISNNRGNHRYRILSSLMSEIEILLQHLNMGSNSKESWENIDNRLKALLGRLNLLNFQLPLSR